MAQVTDAVLDNIIASYVRDRSAPVTAWEVYQMAHIIKTLRETNDGR